ncbi:ATP-binding protein [Streptomyces sp. SBST2-5]|uniref:ATP-binding protein n=1 Tax=Streptomyces composti TaxID=2720025 RepID=A0ABX1AA28_9ACTN|nr:ATP-binding protein [Streptomyces composti]
MPGAGRGPREAWVPGTGVTTAAAARAHAETIVRAHRTVGRTPHPGDLIDLSLVVSELVTDAIRHGDGLAGFDVTTTADGVRIAVHDHSDVIPEAALGGADLPPVHRGNGYGWPLVSRLAREIDARRRPGGKTIAVLVPVRDAAAPDGG